MLRFKLSEVLSAAVSQKSKSKNIGQPENILCFGHIRHLKWSFNLLMLANFLCYLAELS